MAVANDGHSHNFSQHLSDLVNPGQCGTPLAQVQPSDVQQEVLRDPVEDTSGEKIQDSWKGRQRSSDRTARSRSCRRRCSTSLGARVTAV